MEEFSLEGRPHVALNDLLKLMGWCDSGGMAKHVVAEGLVTVDGTVETRKTCKIGPGRKVEFQGNAVLTTE